MVESRAEYESELIRAQGGLMPEELSGVEMINRRIQAIQTVRDHRDDIKVHAHFIGVFFAHKPTVGVANALLDRITDKFIT